MDEEDPERGWLFGSKNGVPGRVRDRAAGYLVAGIVIAITFLVDVLEGGSRFTVWLDAAAGFWLVVTVVDLGRTIRRLLLTKDPSLLDNTLLYFSVSESPDQEHR